MKRLLLVLTLLSPILLLAADQKPAKEEKVLVLDPMVIRSIPLGSFAIDLGLKRDDTTGKVERMFITGVAEDTDAEAAGLQVGDEILKINGRSVKEFDATVKKDSPLGLLLINRTPGDPIQIEVLVRRIQTLTLRAQKNPMPQP